MNQKGLQILHLQPFFWCILEECLLFHLVDNSMADTGVGETSVME